MIKITVLVVGDRPCTPGGGDNDALFSILSSVISFREALVDVRLDKNKCLCENDETFGSRNFGEGIIFMGDPLEGKRVDIVVLVLVPVG